MNINFIHCKIIIFPIIYLDTYLSFTTVILFCGLSNLLWIWGTYSLSNARTTSDEFHCFYWISFICWRDSAISDHEIGMVFWHHISIQEGLMVCILLDILVLFLDLLKSHFSTNNSMDNSGFQIFLIDMEGNAWKIHIISESLFFQLLHQSEKL